MEYSSLHSPVEEDARCNDESESVTNQRKIILEFIEKNFENGQYEISGVYVDDGRSGTTEDTRLIFKGSVGRLKQER